MGRRALILGSTGQDGQLMAQLLRRKGYRVEGYRRCLPFLLESDHWDEVYCLGGLSSVAQSFRDPRGTYESNVEMAWRLMEWARSAGNVRICFAGSSESFGNIAKEAADESTPHRPLSPYGQAKAMLRDLVCFYRDLYSLHVCTAVLFNHTSHLQRPAYLIPRILEQARTIPAGTKRPRVVLGNVEVDRDWGWAPDYVRAMRAMLRSPIPRDYVVSTGETHTLRDIVNGIYRRLDLGEPEIVTDASLLRPRDITRTCGNPQRLVRHFGWQPTKFEELLDRIVRPPADVWAVNAPVSAAA